MATNAQVSAKDGVPAILTDGGKPIAKGERVTVLHEFFRNGEGWVKTEEYGEFPDVFLAFDCDA